MWKKDKTTNERHRMVRSQGLRSLNRHYVSRDQAHLWQTKKTRHPPQTQQVNQQRPTFLHFSSTLHVHPLFRTKQNRLMLLTAPLLPDTHHETCICHHHTPASNILCFSSLPLARQTAVGLLLQRERTRDGIEDCRV